MRLIFFMKTYHLVQIWIDDKSNKWVDSVYLFFQDLLRILSAKQIIKEVRMSFCEWENELFFRMIKKVLSTSRDSDLKIKCSYNQT